MSHLKGLAARVRSMFDRRGAESRMEEEFRFHVEMEAERLVVAGLAPDDAKRCALMSFGGLDRYREVMRDGRGAHWGAIARSFRGAFRTFRRRPGFFAVAVGSLAIALGLSTAVFAMIDSLMHPLAANRDVEQLYTVTLTGYGTNLTRPTTEDLYRKFRAVPAFSALTVSALDIGMVEGRAGSDRRRFEHVLPNYFTVMGLTPRIGRLFSTDEYERGGVAIVSDRLWRSMFGNRPAIGDATLFLESMLHDRGAAGGGRTYTIVGVLPRNAQTEDILLAISERGMFTRPSMVHFLSRLKPDIPLQILRQQIAPIADYYTTTLGRHARWPFRTDVGALRPNPIGIRSYHKALAGAAAGILLIACLNVAALMLARGVAGRRDYSLHLALGARARDLVRGVAAEVTLIGVGGAVLGAVLAVWASQALIVSMPEDMTFVGLPMPQLSPRVFVFSLIAGLASIAAAAALPAWYAGRVQPSEPLKESSGTTTGRSASRFRLLVVAEIAMSMTLLMGASLMAKSVREVTHFDFGYNARDLISANMTLYYGRDSTGRTTAAERTRIADDILARIRALPGVRSAATWSSGTPDSNTIISDRTGAGGAELVGEHLSYQTVGTGFFTTLGLPIVSGREFIEPDRATGGAVILSQAAARVLFPRGDAVGRLVKLGDMSSPRPWLPVVGVVRSVHFSFPRVDPAENETDAPDVYAYLPGGGAYAVRFVVAPRANAPAVFSSTQHVLKDLTPPRTAVLVRPLIAEYESILRSTSYIGRIFVVLGAASLLLAATGLFSVLSYAVSQRMREFAVRVALGARPVNLLGTVFRDALTMALAGTAIGAALGMWAGFLIWAVLWGVYPVDAESLVLAELALLLATVVSSILPALRATRADPLAVMRAS